MVIPNLQWKILLFLPGFRCVFLHFMFYFVNLENSQGFGVYFWTSFLKKRTSKTPGKILSIFQLLFSFSEVWKLPGFLRENLNFFFLFMKFKNSRDFVVKISTSLFVFGSCKTPKKMTGKIHVLFFKNECQKLPGFQRQNLNFFFPRINLIFSRDFPRRFYFFFGLL